MTKVKVVWYDDVKVKSDGAMIWPTVQGEEVELDLRETRELIEALQKHIKKVEEGK